VPPVLTAASILARPETKALEHGTFLLVGIVVLAAAAESVLKVLIVLVALGGLLACNVSLLPGRRIEPQRTGCIIGCPCCAAVTNEVPLVKQLDKRVFAMAGDGARVAYAGRDVELCGTGGRRVACETGIEALTKRTEVARACVELLLRVSLELERMRQTMH
jgi:hypothetical protein